MSTCVGPNRAFPRTNVGRKGSSVDKRQERVAFGRWLKQELWRAELSQAEFARRTGATPSMVSFWVRGERTPLPENIQRIAAELGLDVDEVLAKAGHRPADYDQPDETTRAVMGIMHRLPDDERAEVEAFARYRLERWHRQQRLRQAAPPSSDQPEWPAR